MKTTDSLEAQRLPTQENPGQQRGRGTEPLALRLRSESSASTRGIVLRLPCLELDPTFRIFTGSHFSWGAGCLADRQARPLTCWQAGCPALRVAGCLSASLCLFVLLLLLVLFLARCVCYLLLLPLDLPVYPSRARAPRRSRGQGRKRRIAWLRTNGVNTMGPLQKYVFLTD